VAEQIADDLERHTLGDQRGGAVPELVGMPMTKSGAGLDLGAGLVEVLGAGVAVAVER